MTRKLPSLRDAREDRLGPAVRTINEVAKVLGSVCQTELEVPSFEDGSFPERVKGMKEFCVGLLENPENHTWWPKVSTLGRRERATVAGSLFLTRKVLPSLPDPRQAEKHMELMSVPAPKLSPEYLQFIDDKVNEMFPEGWDHSYRSHVYSHTPTSSSCLNFSRRHGGAQRYCAEQGRDWYLDHCLSESPKPSFTMAKYSVVKTSGKERGVTVADGYHQVLGPLHRTLYDHLSQFEWLLRGEARGKKFKGFKRNRKEVYVSGDYESATDNLSCEAAERILSRVLSRARSIPQSMRAYALRTLRSVIFYPGGHGVWQARGQLMGNYLSFPLLCLQNYIAFKFLVPREVPVRINGDDIVFRASRSEARIWMEGVCRTGLTLSKGKTLVDSTLFSLNSSFFHGEGNRVREIPVIRPSQLVTKDGSLPTGASFCRFIRNWTFDNRRQVGALFLRAHSAKIRASGRSVWGLGIPADNSQLHTAGLAVRESFFRGPRKGDRLPEVPIPKAASEVRDKHGEEWICTSERLYASRSEEDDWMRRWKEVALDLSWTVKSCYAPASDDLWQAIKKGSREQQYTMFRRTMKRGARLLGRMLNTTLRPPDVGSLPARARWVPAYDVSSRRLFRPGIGQRRI